MTFYALLGPARGHADDVPGLEYGATSSAIGVTVACACQEPSGELLAQRTLRAAGTQRHLSPSDLAAEWTAWVWVEKRLAANRFCSTTRDEDACGGAPRSRSPLLRAAGSCPPKTG